MICVTIRTTEDPMVTAAVSRPRVAGAALAVGRSSGGAC